MLTIRGSTAVSPELVIRKIFDFLTSAHSVHVRAFLGSTDLTSACLKEIIFWCLPYLCIMPDCILCKTEFRLFFHYTCVSC